MARLWELTFDCGHSITPATRRFVEQWVATVARHARAMCRAPETVDFVRRREMALKRARSRFTNRRALDQSGGSSGLGRLTYRWPTAKSFLRDLYSALQPGAPAC